jgi:hypothetical protein
VKAVSSILTDRVVEKHGRREFADLCGILNAEAQVILLHSIKQFLPVKEAPMRSIADRGSEGKSNV